MLSWVTRNASFKVAFFEFTLPLVGGSDAVAAREGAGHTCSIAPDYHLLARHFIRQGRVWPGLPGGSRHVFLRKGRKIEVKCHQTQGNDKDLVSTHYVFSSIFVSLSSRPHVIDFILSWEAVGDQGSL